MINLVVRSDTVVTPQGVGAYDIAIDDERIVAMAANGSLPVPDGAKLIECMASHCRPNGVVYCARRKERGMQEDVGLQVAEKQKAPREAGLFVVKRTRKPDYLIFVSLYATCLRTTGSNFMISIFSGMLRLFFVVV